ncbi:hypothetical protein L3Y34_005894 [Caenorhabditis briggsae]|uniref:Acyltransferase 3 domain-containing protein n=1 Tax=Caenorhabditis briggsae TaxID=6238 RepID=A0AAE8ZZQ9_CAEBR|nr:hypothetical protein L3Y34_005894 [Caenorhabditis briggsae]
MPSSCGENDLVEIFNQMTNFPLTACEAFRSDVKVEKTWVFWAFSLFLVLIVSIVVSASFVDYIREREIGMSAVNEHAYCKSNLRIQFNVYFSGLRVFLSFSLWSNSELILSVREHKPDQIRSLDCLRALTILWIVFAHTYDFKFPYNNVGSTMDFLQDLSISRQLIMNSYFSIDTLFVISGVVEAYTFFWNKPKQGTILKPQTWIHFYLRRYLRAAPPLMAFIGFFTVYSKFIQGPFMASEMRPIGNFMCHPCWQPFGRLSYCAYIVHRMTMYWFFNLDGTSPHSYSAVQMFLFYTILGTLLSCVFAFFWSSIFEIPVAKIEKIFLKPISAAYRRESNPAVETVRVRRGAMS